MDTLRGTFGTNSDGAFDAAEDAALHQAPPAAIGQDERRMQVRAYNHWASLLQDNKYPSIEDLDPFGLNDFGPYSVLLDFTGGIENPGIAYLGDRLAEECGLVADQLLSLDSVPSRSLLSRITDHYMQILANQTPIGFEAEFVNQRDHTVLYRGILLPFSSDDDTIDFIYGVINWKELAEQHAADALLLEIDQELEARPSRKPLAEEELTDWADGPVALTPPHGMADSLPRPSFGLDDLPVETAFGMDTGDTPPAVSSPGDNASLADWLAAAREQAAAASVSEDRTRSALYAAIGHAYDFSLAAAAAPAEFEDLLADAGLTVQERAPMTPVVKLVFGSSYDKTRLTEYATALNHAHRAGLPAGSLGEYLRTFEGGLKGLVRHDRALRREQAGRQAADSATPRQALARKLRALPASRVEDIAPVGSEFALVMIRRSEAGDIAVLGELADDAGLIERAARKLVG